MKDLMNNANELDRKNIKLVFESSEVELVDSSNEIMPDFYYCELMDKEYKHAYIAQLIAPTQREAISMRDNVLFGLNHRAKLEAENEALKNKVSQQQNEIDNLKQR